jgi:cell division protein FtsW
MTMAAMGLLLRISYELERARRQVARLRGEPAGAPQGALPEAPRPVGLHAARLGTPPAAPTPSATRADPRGTSRLRPRVEPTFGGRNIA